MNKIITTFLQDQGFNENDIAVYLDVHKYGQSFASTVSARTKIDRTTVYSTINRLLNSGYLVQTVVNGVKAFIPVSPEVFIQSINTEIDDLIAQKEMAALFASEMKKIVADNSIKPQIRIFEGEDAIVNLYAESVDKAGVQKAFINLTHLPKGVEKFLKGAFIEKKLKKGVFSKVLVAENKYCKRYKELDKTSNRETTIIKSHAFALYAEILLFNKTEVAIIDFNEQIYGIVINSPTLYKTIESLFDLTWETSNLDPKFAISSLT